MDGEKLKRKKKGREKGRPHKVFSLFFFHTLVVVEVALFLSKYHKSPTHRPHLWWMGSLRPLSSWNSNIYFLYTDIYSWVDLDRDERVCIKMREDDDDEMEKKKEKKKFFGRESL